MIPAGGPYICLMMGPKAVSAFLFDSQVKKQSQVYYYQDEKSALEACDRAVSELGDLAEGVSQTFFVFEKGFSEGGMISEEKKPFLKKITDELNLVGMGFSVTSEVVAESLSQKDHHGFLLLNFSPDDLHLSLVKNKELTNTEKVGRSGRAEADFTEGLARIKAQGALIPAKVFCFSFTLDNLALDKIEQELLAVDWRSVAFFDQVPDINVIKRDELLKLVVAFAGKTLAQEETALSPSREESQSTPEEFGFQPVMAKSFGVPIDQSKLPEFNPKEELATAVIDHPKHKKSNLIKKIMHHKFIKEHIKMIGIGLVTGLVSLVGLLFLTLYLIRTAEVTITPDQKPVALDMELAISSSSQEEGSILGQLIKSEFQQREVLATTGVKLVGDKATGRVSVLNKTSSDKTFGAGTVLTSGKYKFTLDSEVVVASASVKENSSGDGEVKEYGKGEVNITASEIGAESNLAKNSEFSIADYASDSFSATALDDSTKGSSREIQVVSKEDLTTLYAEAKKAILTKAETEFDQKSDGEKYYVLSGKVKEMAAEYDSEVGDEVKELALDLTLSVEAYEYNKNDLFAKVKSALSDQVPANYSLADEDPQILSSAKVASNSGQVTLEVNASSLAKANLDLGALSQAIKGLPIDNAQSSLEGRPEIDQAEVKIKPFLSSLVFSRVPSNIKKILINGQ